jgi:hypothetical protein
MRLRLERSAKVPEPDEVVGLRVLGPHTCFYDAQDQLIGQYLRDAQ